MSKRSFARYLLIKGTKRWGGFMAVGGHLSITQTDWHWILEICLAAGLDLLLVVGLYFEWHEHRGEK